jgi:heterodisulfide reductase subunit A-like polyferredoxin
MIGDPHSKEHEGGNGSGGNGGDPTAGAGGNGGTIGAVMVVGGGIGGMQAALDLAESGFKVYLVEKEPCIGGKMAQLDKTFPTNDCAMCTISPRLSGTGRHPNIEVITNAQLERVEGEPGRLAATIRRYARFIDLRQCTGCGECEKVCPIEVPAEFELGLTGRKAIFRRYPQAVPNAYSIDKLGYARCKINCPAETSVQGYVALIAEGRYEEALQVIYRANPLPGVTARICHHPCEEECGRGECDEPVAIRQLRRFLTDAVYASPDFKPPEPLEKTQEKSIAIIGAGPAGLSCANYLARLGYRTTVFDALPKPGGMLRVGLPDYRLPKDVLDLEVGLIESLGVEIKSGKRLGTDFTLGDLRDQGYGAFFVAVGAHLSRQLRVEGEDLEDALPGIPFLRDVSLGKPVKVGKKVLVIGGGNVAIDVAKTARRVGGEDIHIICLESREEMPAHEWEVDEALEEEFTIHPSLGIKRLLGENGKVTGIETLVCSSVFDEEGRFNPTLEPNTEAQIYGDTVIVAIGQASDLSFAEQEGLAVTRRGLIEADPGTQRTSLPDVFAGGDAVRGPASAIEAIADGHRAAISIDRFLQGEEIEVPKREVPTAEARITEQTPSIPREQPARLPVPERIDNFREIEQAFTEEQARREAARCLACAVCSDCRLCEIACEANAIVHDMDEEKVETLDVGAVILAPGFELFDVDTLGEFGHKRYANVVSSLEFERILSASGPYQGKIIRPSDGELPKRIAWIQCVGSREADHNYCSSVCCMYATKQAIIAMEHEPDVSCQIFFIDLRAFGKGFDAYYERAKELGVVYTRCRPSSIKEVPGTKDLMIRYQNEQGEIVTDIFNMVVLSGGLVPGDDIKDLADRLSVRLNEHGFCWTDPFDPLSTTRDGIYVCGPFVEPKDIPETVVEASGVASRVGGLLASARNTCVEPKVYPPEKDVSKEGLRIGVFICHCGRNIGSVVDVPAVVEEAATLPDVAHAEHNLYSCSQDALEHIKQTIEEHQLNRVIVASCTPRTHEPLFQDTIREAGLNPYFFEMANIRDQCSWVHPHEHERATGKARDLVRMAVARAHYLEPLYKQDIPLTKTALVIGGGPAGMVSALDLARQGFPVHLVEREDELGGNLRHLHYLLDGGDPQAFLGSLRGQVEAEERITVHRGSEVTGFTGFVGNFTVTIGPRGEGGNGGEPAGGPEEVKCGVIIVATGGQELRDGHFLHDTSERVLTQQELEMQLVDGSLDPSGLREVVMIQCVGSRNEERPYCSRICCGEAIKNALKLKELNPEIAVYVLYREVRSYGFREEFYREAREKGVIFLRYADDDEPQVSENGKLVVRMKEMMLGADVTIEPDLVVLSSAIVPDTRNEALAQLLKVSLNPDGFFLEAHMKLRPVDFASEGMFLCGLAHYPKYLSEALAQASAAASRASRILSLDMLSVGGAVAVVDEDRCAACLTCLRVCPYDVPRIVDGVAVIEIAACQGCGTCSGECPAKAIELKHTTDVQVCAKIDGLVS